MRRIAALLLLLIAASGLSVAAAADYTKMTDVRVAMDDGVVLNADVYVPTAPDRDGDTLYPCVVEMTPYRKEGRATEGASYLPGVGVALIEVDARGTGGSSGEYDIVFSVREQADAAAWIEWAALSAKKPDGSKLCEETVGMYGGSYSGIIQYLVASLPVSRQGDVPAAPPHLAAIAPQRAFGDLYRDIVYHGGMVTGSFGTAWSSAATALYTQPPSDLGTDAGNAAWTDHMTKNDPMWTTYLASQYADASFTSNDTSPGYTQALYADSSILSRIENLRVPTLHLAGWFDAFTRGQLRTFTEAYALERSLGGRGPNHLIVAPTNHTGTHFITPPTFTSRLGDWYLWWLEGRAAGLASPSWLSGPRVTYFDMTSGKANGLSDADGTWRTASDWPPPITPTRLRLGGMLVDGPPSPVACVDACPTSYDYTPTSGLSETGSRWDNAVPGVPYPQLDQRLENGRGVSFHTAPLTAPLSLAGPIGLHLVAGTTGVAGDPSMAAGWPGTAQATPPYHDTDFVVKLSDVAPDGTTILITQGYLRASHRALDTARSTYIDGSLMAPYHPHTLAALDPPPADGTARAYEIEIWPTAKTFLPGHSLRVDVTSSDTANHITLAKRATNDIYMDGPWTARDSYLTLPVVP